MIVDTKPVTIRLGWKQLVTMSRPGICERAGVHKLEVQYPVNTHEDDWNDCNSAVPSPIAFGGRPSC